MAFRRYTHRVGLLLAAALIPYCAHGQTAPEASTSARPSVRVTQVVDNSQTVTLAGTHPRAVESATVGARLSSSTPLSHMMLVLSPTDEQEAALHQLLGEQQDKTSPNYHKWLTPETYAAHFGVASADVARVTGWLQDQGFTVNGVSRSTRVVTFSGTAGQVEAAFHTQMNRVTVNGEAHIANTTDVSIPAAFAGVVHGVASLNDFFPKSNAVGARKVEFPAENYVSREWSPNYTSTSSGAHYVTPGDVATIYNSTPLLKAGIDGTGVSIAVIGRTDITVSDVQQFRSMFGLKKNDPAVTVIGEDPGVNSDDTEAYLDVEWAGGVAPGASVNFVVGGTDYATTGGISNAGLYAVDNNVADIITMSYGGCESNNGATGTAFWNTLWEQAAAQGQTVFVSSGDSNATGCSSSSSTYGTAYGVNALGSSAYNVAVGGTQFVDFAPNQYWTTGSTAPVPAGYNFATATGYIPETVWNQGSLAPALLNTASTATTTGSGIVGGGGGISIFTARPAWQTGSGISATADPTCSSGSCIATGTTVTGVHRLVPDVSFIASSAHDATAYCAEGSCYNTTTGYGIGAVGGTSVAAPVMASVQALINQKNGGRQGNANFYYYRLANADYTAGTCQSLNGTAASPTVTLPAATCNFHDIVTGNNRSKSGASDTVGLGFDAGTGYDAASGLGSVNIANVANNWSTVNFNSTATSLSLTPTTLATHGTSQSFTVNVTSGAGTPTGDVSIIAVTTMPGTALRYTLSGGSYSGTLNSLPGGTYNVHAHYEGDGTFAPSDSAPVQVSIGKEASTISTVMEDFYPGYVQTGQTSVPYGYSIDLMATVAGASGAGLPTGQLTFTVAQNGTNIGQLTNNLDGTATAALVAGAGYSTLLLAPNFPALSPGSYTVTMAYSGDNSFQPTTTTFNFTVTASTTTVAISSSSSYINSGSPVTLNCSVARTALTPTLAAYASGTCTFKNTTAGTTLGTATLNSAGVGTLTTSAITATAAVTASYSGDTNYASSTSSATTVTVGTLTPTSLTLSYTAGTYYVLSTVPLTATISPATAGTVTFYDGGVRLASATANSSGVATYNATTLVAGSHNLSATFSGTSTYSGSTGSTTLTVAQNVTSLILDAPAYATVGETVYLNGRLGRSPSTTTAGNVVPTGTVTFYDGTTVIATATPVYMPGGYYYYLATGSTNTLARGPHTITAQYSGDANFTASTSTAVKMVVTPNNIWVVNSTGSIAGVSGSGTSLGTSTGGGTGLIVDNLGQLWSLNKTANTLSTFSSTGTLLNSGYASAGLNAPAALAIDGAGVIWVANGNSTISAVSSSGTVVTPSTGYPAATSTPTSLNIDASGNVWITNAGNSSVTEVIGVAAPAAVLSTAAANNSIGAKP